MEWRRKVPYPADIYLFKVNKRNTRARCEICSKLTIKTPEWYQWRRSGVFVANFEHISHHDLVFALLTCNCHVIVSWVGALESLRSSPSEVFFGNGVLLTFPKITSRGLPLNSVFPEIWRVYS